MPAIEKPSAGRRAWQPLGSSAILPNAASLFGAAEQRGAVPRPFCWREPSAHLRLPMRPVRAHLRGAAADLGSAADGLRSLRRPDPPAPVAGAIHPQGRRLVRDRLSLRRPEKGDGGREEVDRRSFDGLDDDRDGRGLERDVL